MPIVAAAAPALLEGAAVAGGEAAVAGGATAAAEGATAGAGATAAEGASGGGGGLMGQMKNLNMGQFANMMGGGGAPGAPAKEHKEASMPEMSDPMQGGYGQGSGWE